MFLVPVLESLEIQGVGGTVLPQGPWVESFLASSQLLLLFLGLWLCHSFFFSPLLLFIDFFIVV